MHCNTLKPDNDSTVRGDGGSRVGEVRAGNTSTMAEHKGIIGAERTNTTSVTQTLYPQPPGGYQSVYCTESEFCVLFNDT